MRVIVKTCLTLILWSLLSACSMEASIVSLEDAPVPLRSVPGKMAITPSRQISAQDESGQYRVEGVVGEVTTTDKSYTDDGVYQAEINIRFQVM
ncbi:hypothetical protein Bb109J_c2544 [Bdellovibrio bacteriovorus]|uniref:hypothetical protein n=2 Tax=Bdellovibrio bacteriovorus TaxID=959 RepID=UPI000B13B8C5|nr:hypothetical protein Bb109J_c2544 [Bdellovibrio bacteriovorus]